VIGWRASSRSIGQPRQIVDDLPDRHHEAGAIGPVGLHHVLQVERKGVNAQQRMELAQFRMPFLGQRPFPQQEKPHGAYQDRNRRLHDRRSVVVSESRESDPVHRGQWPFAFTLRSILAERSFGDKGVLCDGVTWCRSILGCQDRPILDRQN